MHKAAPAFSLPRGLFGYRYKASPSERRLERRKPGGRLPAPQDVWHPYSCRGEIDWRCEAQAQLQHFSITCSLLHSRISLAPVLPGTETCLPSEPTAVPSGMKSFLRLVQF